MLTWIKQFRNAAGLREITIEGGIRGFALPLIPRFYPGKTWGYLDGALKSLSRPAPVGLQAGLHLGIVAE